MKSITKIKMIEVSVVFSVALLIVNLGIGCGGGFDAIRNLDEASLALLPGPSDSGNNGDLQIVAGAKTVAVTNFKSAFDNMVSMAGVTPSNATLTAFNNNVGSFSETGGVLTINAPMLLAYASVGAEVCNDLVNQENQIAQANAANRRFFGQLDFGTNNSTAIRDTNLTDGTVPAGISDSVRRLARQFWQRNETQSELDMVNAGVQDILGSAPALPTANIQRRVALYMCASMIASTAGYQL